MELITTFYDNALIYSPNIFFIFLIFTLLLIGGFLYSFVKGIFSAAEYIVKTQKKRKKTRHNRTKVLLKITYAIYIVVNRKIDKIAFYISKIINAIKKEVLIKEGEQV